MKRILASLTLALTTIPMAVAQRLPEVAAPENYKLTFTPNLEKATFEGDETISLRVLKPTSEITLNADDIDFHDVTVTSGGNTQKATVTPAKAKEMVVLTLANPLRAGSATVHITYTGILNSEMRGLYLGKDDQGRKYAASQFEATDARRAFPSFDEPAYKATFDVTLIAEKAHTAISNGKVASDIPGQGNGKHTVHFATTPKMSSYLVALAVGNFDYVEGSADGIPIRIYTAPGKTRMANFALEVAERCLRYFNEYFTIKYPFQKLDMIAVPDFSSGAMENTGAIIYSELDLLL